MITNKIRKEIYERGGRKKEMSEKKERRNHKTSMIMGSIIQIIWRNTVGFQKCSKFAKTFFLALILKVLLKYENVL